MNSVAPVAIMLAGPNGAGKTTTAMSLFRERLRSVEATIHDAIVWWELNKRYGP